MDKKPTVEDVDVKNPVVQKTVGENRAPPIFVSWCKRLKYLRAILNEGTNEECKVQYIGNNDVMIQASTMENYKAITERLKAKKIHFDWSQFLPEKDVFKVILRGLEYTTEQKKIYEALLKVGHKVVTISTAMSREGEPEPLFVLKLQKGENNYDIFNIKRLLNTNVLFEDPSSVDQFYFHTKCDNCQDFGHTSQSCPQLNCVLCSEAHYTIDCPLNLKSLHMKCFNCGRSHSPTYDCALVREVEEKQGKEKSEHPRPPAVNSSAYPPISKQPKPEPEPFLTIHKFSYAQMAKTPTNPPPKPEPSLTIQEPKTPLFPRPKSNVSSLRLPPSKRF